MDLIDRARPARLDLLPRAAFFGGAGGREGGRSTQDRVGFSRISPDGLSGEDVMIRVLGAEATAEERAKALDAVQRIADIGPRPKRAGATTGASPSCPEAVTAPDGTP